MFAWYLTFFVFYFLIVIAELISDEEISSIVAYEAQVHFGTRVRVRVRVQVRDSAIFEKGGCECGRTRRLKNY